MSALDGKFRCNRSSLAKTYPRIWQGICFAWYTGIVKLLVILSHVPYTLSYIPIADDKHFHYSMYEGVKLYFSFCTDWITFPLHFAFGISQKILKCHQYLTEHFNHCLMHCEHKKSVITFIKMVTKAHYLIIWTSIYFYHQPKQCF